MILPEHCQEPGGGGGIAAKTGANEHGLDARIFKRGEITGVADQGWWHALWPFGSEQLYIACASALRRFSRQQRRAGHLACDDREETPAVFVRVGRRRSKPRLAKKLWRARNRCHADIDQPQRTHQRCSRHGPVRRLPCTEGNCKVESRQAGVEASAAVRLYPARQICRDAQVMCLGKGHEQKKQVI